MLLSNISHSHISAWRTATPTTAGIPGIFQEGCQASKAMLVTGHSIFK